MGRPVQPMYEDSLNPLGLLDDLHIDAQHEKLPRIFRGFAAFP